MFLKLILTAFLFLLLSCNGSSVSSTDKPAENTEQPAGSKEAERQALNDQSRECIRLMNRLEEEKNAAIAAGDRATAFALSNSIDSAAMENVKIGQKLAELDK